MKGHAHLQQRVLEALSAGLCLTTDQLAELSGLDRRAVSNAASGLIRRGYLERIEVGCYQFTEAGLEAKASGEKLTTGPNAPLTQVCRRRRKRTNRDMLWSALRKARGKPTIADLLETAGLDPEKSYANARRFMRALTKAGVVYRLPRRGQPQSLTSNGNYRFVLARNLGPATPVVQKDGVYDPNTKSMVTPEVPS